jgi:hypothetical protein
MKDNLFFLMLLFCLGATNNAFSQPTAVGGCNSAEVTGGIPVSTAGLWVGTTYGSGPCFRIAQQASGAPCGDGVDDPRFTLQRLNHSTGTWSTVSTQFCPLFNNITVQGTYRIGIQLPTPISGSAGCAGGVVRVTSPSGQFLGNQGAYTNSSFVFTNTFLVGATTSANNSFTFVDVGVETGPEPAFDFGELARINASASKNYDLWHLAIFESGSTYNRYASNGWSTGTVPSNFSLTSVWTAGGTRDWKFETLHTYTVQFVTENSECRNGIEFNPGADWNVRERTFFICPAGSGCRIGEDAQKIVLSPNPASSVVRLNHFEMDEGIDYQLIITDLAGKAVRNTTLSSNEVDISGLSNGMYAMTITRDGKRMFTDKLIISQ